MVGVSQRAAEEAPQAFGELPGVGEEEGAELSAQRGARQARVQASGRQAREVHGAGAVFDLPAADRLAALALELFEQGVESAEFRQMCPGKFDAATLIEVIEHIPPEECVSVLNKIADVLKPAGTFVLTTPSVNYPNTHANHYRHFTERGLRNLVQDSGCFSITSVEGYGDVPAENAHFRLARFVDNRYYCVKPAISYLRRRTARSLVGPTPFDRCHGFIVTMRRHS